MSRRLRDRAAQEQVEARAARLFSPLSNGTRVGILFALAEAERDVGRPVPFSEIYRRMDVRDSSKFNYHLKALTESFVRRTDAGYELRYVGRLVYRAINAGEFDDAEVLEPTRIDSECVRCGAALTARFDDGRLLVWCGECGDLSYRITIPSGALVGRSLDEVLDAADYKIRSDIALVSHGICPYCTGRTTAAVRDASDAPTDNVYVNHDCEQCGQCVLSTTAGELFLAHPAVVAFCYDHGLDLSGRRCWELDFCVTDDHVTLVPGDEWRVELDLALEAATLHVVLDADLQTVEASVDPLPAE